MGCEIKGQGGYDIWIADEEGVCRVEVDLDAAGELSFAVWESEEGTEG